MSYLFFCLCCPPPSFTHLRKSFTSSFTEVRLTHDGRFSRSLLALMSAASTALSCSHLAGPDAAPRSFVLGRARLSFLLRQPFGCTSSFFSVQDLCVCAIVAVAGDCPWQQCTMGDGLICLPAMLCGRLGPATAASSTWRPESVAPQPALRNAVASQLVACLSLLSGLVLQMWLSSALRWLWDISFPGSTPVPPRGRRGGRPAVTAAFPLE